MLEKTQDIKSCRQLLKEFSGKNQGFTGEKLDFRGVGGRDVYNITAPFEDEGEPVIAGRVEPREDGLASEVVFFICRGGVWIPRENTATMAMQDPFVARIGGELVIGGVEIHRGVKGAEFDFSWSTPFYKGRCINDLKLFARGPLNMKDIRLVELAGGRTGVFTRPHGLPGARAKIGFTVVGSLEELHANVIESADLFHDQFLKDEWGGCNEPHRLKNGLIGVLGHVCYKEKSDILHYHAMTFALDPTSGEKTPLKIIADRECFPAGPSKEDRLRDVVFSGGLVRRSDGKAWLYAGVSDAEAHRLLLPDPFLEYEAL